jgi:serine/threonine protein kinase
MQMQLTPVERRLVLERLCLAVDFVHSKSLVIVDLKPQNVVIFGSLLSLKLIDLECLRKTGENLPFKLTPYYCAPELAAAALETMRLGELPALEYQRPPDEPDDATPGAGSDMWGPNLQKLGLVSENPTIARAVAAASQAANKAGDGSQQLNRDDVRMLQAPLKMANGKPLRAQPTMDLWALGMVRPHRRNTSHHPSPTTPASSRAALQRSLSRPGGGCADCV